MKTQNKKTNIWEERLNAFFNKLVWLADELDMFADELAVELDDLALKEGAAAMIPETLEERKSELEGNIEIIQNAADYVREAVESLEEVSY